MMLGADADGGVTTMPNQPDIPIADIIDKLTTSDTSNVADKERNNKNTDIKIRIFVISFFISNVTRVTRS